MKIPTTNSIGNGYYNYGDSYILDNVVNNQNGTPAQDSNSGNDSSNPDGDFAEYLWMENEEEFDKEVMQQLEEEALMEQCIEAMLEDELSSQEASMWNQNTTAATDLCNQLGGIKLDDKEKEQDGDKDKGEDKSTDEILKSSKLNPLAAVFVPGAKKSPAASPKPSST